MRQQNINVNLEEGGEDDDDDDDMSDESNSNNNQDNEENDNDDDGMETVSFLGPGENNDDDDDSSLSSSSSSSAGSYTNGGGDGYHGALLTIPSTIQQARTNLAKLSGVTNWHNQEKRDYFFRMLQAFPALAALGFNDDDNELKYPLALLLRNKASLEIIESVYHMYPEAISEPNGSNGDTLLHDACWYGASDRVVRFIAMEYPDALTKTNDFRRLPVQDAMRCYCPSADTHSNTIRLLIEMYPECMAIAGNDGELLLESAFRRGLDLELLDWMTKRWPQGMRSFNCSSPASTPLDQPMAALVVRVLPHLTFLRCDPHEWTVDGFVSLMGHLARIESLEVLELLAFPGQLMVDSPEAQRAFSNFIQHTNLSKLVIAFPRLGNLLENFCDTCLGIMGNALQHNTTLKRLELRQMLLDNSNALSDLLLTAKAPKELILQQIGFQGRVEKVYNPPGRCHNGGIETLEIVDCPMTPKAMEHIVHNISRMPSLNHLSLKFNPAAPGTSLLSLVDLTNPLVHILHQNTVHWLEVDGLLKFDFNPICKALRTNTSLHTIISDSFCDIRTNENLELLADVLQKDNTTLQHCGLVSIGCHDKRREKVIELIRLNLFGRGRTRAADTTIDEFLKDLDVIQNTPSLKLPIHKLTIHYGLLRETPSLWCNMPI